MTFSEIQTEILDRLNYTSTSATTRVGRLINKVYRQITTELGINVSREASTSVAVTIGSSQVTFTNTEKLDRVWIASDAGVPTILTEVPVDLIRGTALPSNDTPKRYAVYSVTGTSVTIFIDALPVTAYSLMADVMQVVADLSGSNVPAFPESFHDIIIEGVLKDEYRKLEKVQLARDSDTTYQQRLSALRMFLAKSRYLDIQQGNVNASKLGGVTGTSGGSGSSGLGQTPYTQTSLLTFDLGAGIAPFAVTQSDAATVTNLDADKLDGQHGSYYTNASNLASGTVPVARLSGITNTEISATAAIVYSKLSLTGGVVNADVSASAAIAYSKLNLTGGIVNADVNAAAAIAWSKLDKTGSSLADLATRSATNVDSGNLPWAQLPTSSGSWAGTPTISGLITASAGVSSADDLIFSANKLIRRNTSDGSDNGSIEINGGGATGSSRGAGISIFGNEHATKPGYWDVQIGNVASSHGIIRSADGTAVVDILGADGSATLTSSKAGAAWVFNTTATNGGYLQVQKSGTEVFRIGVGSNAGSGDNNDLFIGTAVTNGEIRIRANNSANNEVVITGSSSGIANNSFLPLTDNVLVLGNSGNRWTAVYATSGTVNSSDARVKQHIIDTPLGLSFVRQLRPVQYQWNGIDGTRDTTTPHYGLIAQEVQAVVPEQSSFVDATGPYLGMRYAEFIAPLIKAVQELSTRLEHLEHLNGR